MKKLFFLFFLYSTFYILNPSLVQAASFSAGNIPESVGVGQQFQLDIFVETGGSALNAIEGAVNFSEADFTVRDVRDGNSAIILWVDKPQIVPGAVTFSGVSPNGIVREKSFIISLVLEPRKSGEAAIRIGGSAYLNDGAGTKIALKPAELKISIKKETQAVVAVADFKNDSEPPENFIPAIVRDENLLSGKYAVVFETEDKSSGIDRYEVAEPKPKFFGAEKPEWETAVSPYVLKDQERESFVFVKAVDRNGNERIKKISPENARYPYINYALWFILMVLLLAAGYFVRKKRG